MHCALTNFTLYTGPLTWRGKRYLLTENSWMNACQAYWPRKISAVTCCKAVSVAVTVTEAVSVAVAESEAVAEVFSGVTSAACGLLRRCLSLCP